MNLLASCGLAACSALSCKRARSSACTTRPAVMRASALPSPDPPPPDPRCLQNNKGQKDFGAACRKEVIDYEQRASSDYRLNHRLRTMCAADVESLCKDVCAKGGDQVRGGRGGVGAGSAGW